ncbi:Transcription-repair-coupling factor [Paenibacillus plantiphilus]|uniref:Transcription-repair-coupling factor n=1 Tax=Paenibacillus plantiphilus TaxID=2905650 RepID=A0ABM9BRL9_9BACL|nr:helicase-related protein [Paenibacillus plantiphilus]CAH1193040.1 Transcription-repair-coupling factor [Paenibacillus plantiphilus]
MQVTLYVLLSAKGSRAMWSVAPEVDRAYWLDRGYRNEVERTAKRLTHWESQSMLLWPELLPLGIAVAIAQRWPDREGGPSSERTVREVLGRLVSDAWGAGAGAQSAEEPRASTQSERNAQKARRESAKSERVAQEAKRADAQRARRADAQEAPVARAELVRGASERGADRAGARALAAAACRAAALLQGRALLRSEALALLAAADAAGPAGEAQQAAWSAAAPALQLAALLGQLRLGGAVAPQPQPPLLRWRLALRAEPPRQRLRCQRCGSGEARMRRTPCAVCGRMCAYCEACLTMGRSRECGLLILGTRTPASSALAFASARALTPAASSAPAFATARALVSAEAGVSAFALAPSPAAPAAYHPAPTKGPQDLASIAAASDERFARWQLSPAQAAAAAAALQYIAGAGTTAGGSIFRRVVGLARRLPFVSASRQASQRRFLLWAVTGAGKTEMIFPLIEACLERGGRALIATPRRDVVLELDPRIRRAFPEASVVTLYGGSPQRWESGEITLATTHQLFRFRSAFDLVVIDELDAFPFHNDELLHYAADNVCAAGGCTVLLSATPPAELRRAAKRGHLAHVRVPVRFHRHPLPVPALIRIPMVRQLLHQRRLPGRLLDALKKSLDRGAQLFLFVQQIRHVEPLVQRLRHAFPNIAIEGTSSKDAERSNKVMEFRGRSIRLLVTTTILERGVTVPKSDVFILDADGKLFDEASLVQMAGRAGRSKEDPAGRVYFCAAVYSRSQQAAIRQIRSMNKLAKRSGYLIKK